MWELNYKKSWVPKNWCFWTVVLEKTFESPLDCKEIQPVHPTGNQSWIFIGRTDAEAETPIFWPLDVKNWLIWKDPNAGKDWRREEKGMTEDEMAGWHHWLDGRESQWTLEVGDGQGNLTCCSPWGRKESDTTKRLNWTELNWTIIYIHWWPSKNPTVAWHRWEMVGESSEISMALLVSLRHCVPYSMIYLLFASSRWFIK